jgi:recombination endonuclease VII
MNEIVKICKVHGELTIEQTRKEGIKFRCKECRMESNRKSYYKNPEKRVATSQRWKEQNRGDYNEWMREDRKKFPEKYRKYEANYIEKHGIERVRKMEVARIHGLIVEEYDDLHEKQNGLCEICRKLEKRLSRTTKDKMPLCTDHCHICKERGKHIIRGLLCHNCNSAMGKLHDNIDILKSMINYLEKHEHIMGDLIRETHE